MLMKPYPKYLDWLRYLSAYLLFTYGVSKLAGWQFRLAPEITSKPVGSLSGFQLTWYFYSYSYVYARILGLTQLAGGAMLLFRKTALLGAAAMIPVIANILSHCRGRGDCRRVHLYVDVGHLVVGTGRDCRIVLEPSSRGGA